MVAVDILLAESWRDSADQALRMLNAWNMSFKHGHHLRSTELTMFVCKDMELRTNVYLAMRSAAATVVLDSKACRKAFTMLMDLPSASSGLSNVIRSEWAVALGLLQELYPKGKLNKSVARSIAGVNVDRLSQSRVPPADLASEVDVHFARLIEVASKPLAVRRWDELQAINAACNTGPLADHELRRILFPSMHIFFLNQLRVLAAHRATAVVLLLREYYLKYGKWAASLSQVVPSGNSELLLDPFSAGEFVYQIRKELPLVYSIAEDGEDNHGSHGFWYYRKTIKPGHDFVFWPPK